MVLRIMSCLYADKLIAAHFNMFRAAEPGPDEELSMAERQIVARREEFRLTGRGYFHVQSTKPFTIGLAIGSSPLAILAWIGEKVYAWSDAERVDPMDILDTVALYFLSGSFATSVMIYNQVSWRDQFLWSGFQLPTSSELRVTRESSLTNGPS